MASYQVCHEVILGRAVTPKLRDFTSELYLSYDFILGHAVTRSIVTSRTKLYLGCDFISSLS
jgi:hypothetical protein